MKRRLTIIVENGIGGPHISLSIGQVSEEPLRSNFETDAALARVADAMQRFFEASESTEAAPEPEAPAPAKKAKRAPAGKRRRP